MPNQNARIYVGGYQMSSSTEKLEEIFSKYGQIKDIKRNRNFSFIQYNEENHAKAAISGENGKNYFGKILDVQIAKHSRGPLNERDDKESGGPGHAGPLGTFQGSPFGGNFDNKRDEGFRDGSPGFRGGRPGGPSDDRFDSPFGGPGGQFGPGPGGFDRHQGGPPGGPGGFNGQAGPRSGPPTGYTGGPPGRGGPRYDDGPSGFREGPGPERFSGPPGGTRGGYGGHGGGGHGAGGHGAGVHGGGPSPFRSNLEPSDREHPPTQAPGPLAISHENRTNDVEIIVINKGIIDYGEYIEQKLKALAFTVDLLFPNEEVPLRRVLANIASRGTLYAVLVTPQHREKRSLTLNVLHGAPQEHRNMLVDDAITLISRNYEMYALQTSDKNRELPPEDIRSMLQHFIQGRQLTMPQLDKVLLFFNQQKARIESSSAPGQPPMMPSLVAPGQPPLAPPPKGTSIQEAELQNRILNILNKGGGMQPNPPMAGGPPNLIVGKPPPLLNDPSVQKAIDNLIQGDIFKSMPNPRDFPPTRF